MDEQPLKGAQRELQEETGITAQKWTKILDIDLSNSVTDEVGMAFVAQDLTFGESEPEETEQLQIKKLPFAEVVEMVMRGDITDTLSVTTILKAYILFQGNEL